MEIEELKSYKELWEYAKTVGYENLTDTIWRACKRIKKIFKEKVKHYSRSNPVFVCNDTMTLYLWVPPHAINVSQCHIVSPDTKTRYQLQKQMLMEIITKVNNKNMKVIL